MAKKTSRRNFLRTAPVAAAAGFTLSNQLLFAAQAAAAPSPGADVAAAAAPFKLFTSNDLEADAKKLSAAPGNVNLIGQSAGFPCAIVMTTEVHASAKEFEWHEGRDHIIQIIDGSTLYEVGGTPTGAHVMGPGEWHATGSVGSKSLILGKGDILIIPRGTLHKRSTEDSVTFYLLSPYGKMTA
ncbi:MAG: cupin domain-containing protein [Acidobacteriaceae bacterium]